MSHENPPLPCEQCNRRIHYVVGWVLIASHLVDQFVISSIPNHCHFLSEFRDLNPHFVVLPPRRTSDAHDLWTVSTSACRLRIAPNLLSAATTLPTQIQRQVQSHQCRKPSHVGRRRSKHVDSLPLKKVGLGLHDIANLVSGSGMI